MKSLASLISDRSALTILCIGAHSDDIEIGAGGTILRLIENGLDLTVHWCVLSADHERGEEAAASAQTFLQGVQQHRIHLGQFDDSHFPDQSRAIKEWLIDIREQCSPDIVFTHSHHDAHQDHRTVNRLTTNVFRDHLVVEYEIPKWDGDLTARNSYVPISLDILDRKIGLLMQNFASQRSKDWFDEDVFRGLARLRGMECRSASRFAEAFTIRKQTLF